MAIIGNIPYFQTNLYVDKVVENNRLVQIQSPQVSRNFPFSLADLAAKFVFHTAAQRGHVADRRNQEL